MENNRHSDNALIEALGGTTAVATAMGVSPQTIHNWRVRGVSANWRIAFASLASEMGKPVPRDWLLPRPGKRTPKTGKRGGPVARSIINSLIPMAAKQPAEGRVP